MPLTADSLGRMTDTDEVTDEATDEVEDNTTDEVEGEESEETTPMSKADREKRKKELEDELATLDSPEVQDAADDAADDIADGDAETTDEVEEESEEAADEIAAKAGLSQEERDDLANKIAAKVNKQPTGVSSGGGGSKAKPKARDRRPNTTHFSERKLFGRKGDK